MEALRNSCLAGMTGKNSRKSDSFEVSGIVKKDKVACIRFICTHLEKLVENLNLTVKELHDDRYFFFLSGSHYISGKGEVEAMLDIVSSFTNEGNSKCTIFLKNLTRSVTEAQEWLSISGFIYLNFLLVHSEIKNIIISMFPSCI